MPAAHFVGLCPRLVLAQHPDNLLLAKPAPFHHPSPFSGDGLYLISAEFSGCTPMPDDTGEFQILPSPAVLSSILSVENRAGALRAIVCEKDAFARTSPFT